ncbi:cytochrome-c peroxidase [Aequorivita vladivostokensis]|uniref:Cytochrome C peroxidase n=1 Tax=Aequorivita vladivostokensis TaxID=171194 RepID=A0ABR5DHK4_9FLAO|nr:cytochrome c peroxidase [Aequorivita vladivostokensis]KJJ38219.1 cytochrome C peroxidase [Aequorivita vladivostokensis]
MPRSKKISFVLILFSSISISLFYSFSPSNKEFVKLYVLQQQLSQFKNTTAALEKVASDYQLGKTNQESLQKAVLSAREAYKKIEFYIAFQYPEYTNEHFNGAPLLHIERENTRPTVLEPEGLQVLDELVFSEEAFDEKTKIATLATKLNASYSLLYNSLPKTKNLFDNDIAAMRLQLIRIFSMGITGFDTPGSLSALPEAESSLKGMKAYFAENYKNEKIISLFEGAIVNIQNASNFETFDRLQFLKKYIDPLYKNLGMIQSPKIDASLANTTSWNPTSNSIFAADFLNPYFFTGLKKEEDNAQIKLLGEDLFYDASISNNGQLSCISCHNPEMAFTDNASKSASNVQGKTVLRNAPTLLNSVYADRYFYDLRAFTLEQQAEHVIFNEDEFNTAYSDILKKLNENEKYAKKFREVFGKGEITREKFSKALASYVLSLTSWNSKFDKYVRNESNNLSMEEKNGFNLFMGKASCATCHFAPTFSGLVPPFYSENETEILGVLKDPKAKIKTLDTDAGRIANNILSEEAWIYEKSFKTSTVRNVEFTGPYFHNGAYETLEEVIDFYNEGGGAGMGLNVANQTLAPDKLELTDIEKKELIAFMKTLSDINSYK